MGQVKKYPDKLEALDEVKTFICTSLLTPKGGLKASSLRHIPKHLIDDIITFSPLLNAKSLAEHLLWIVNDYTEHPKKCLECGTFITDFESFNKGYITNFCSSKCSNGSKLVQNTKKQSNLKKFGTEWGWQSDGVKEKTKNTMIDRYGVSHNMQVQEYLDKNQKRRTYTGTLPSGKIIKYQGYEMVAILHLLKSYDEDEILTRSDVPTIRYGNDSWYFPDIYIPKDNLIIEVKSSRTMKLDFDKNLNKRNGVLASGYNFQFWICSHKKLLEII